MRLEFKPNITALPNVENEVIETSGVSSGPDLESLVKNGIKLAQAGDRDQARKVLSQATAIDPTSEDAWMWLASISDYPEELLAFLNRVLEINPQNGRAAEWRTATRSLLAKTFVGRAIDAHTEGLADSAAQSLDHALTFDRDCEQAWFWKAALAADDNHKLEYLERVLTINPENHDALDAVATIRRGASQAAFDEAKEAAAAGDDNRAIKLFDEIVTDPSDPNCEMAWFWKAGLADSDDEKLEFLSRVLEINTDNQDALSAVAEIERSRSHSAFAKVKAASASGDRKKAVKVLDEFLAVSAASVDAWLLKSHLSLSLEDKTASLKKALEIDPENAAAKSGLAFLSLTFGPNTDVENVSQSVSVPVEPAIEESENHDSDILEIAENTETQTTVENAGANLEERSAAHACPFCNEANDSQAFECISCRASLTLSNIESLLSNQHADRDVVQRAVTKMEAEWNLREFDEKELTDLGLGHFNLRNFEPAIKYLEEASRLNPNNVILSGHLNTLAIRLDEIRRQDEDREARPKGRTILVVDDSATVRKLIAGKLEKAGHLVICAVDGVDGLARIEEQMPDLVLLDIAMPRMDGYEVCKQIRANAAAKDLPIVMISGKDGFFDKVRGRMAGTTGYITKPFGPETLMKALETYFENDNGSGE